MSTHSHVAIDYFSKNRLAKIYHVTRRDRKSVITEMAGLQSHSNALDDLGCKASDLLQANGVIWVEGPSDRIYLKKWIEVIQGDDVRFKEGEHFQIVHFGGSLLAHFFGGDPEKGNLDKEKIDLFRVNRNAAVFVDSDQRKKSDQLKPYVQSIKNELVELKIPFFATSGRTIENYLPAKLLGPLLDTKSVCGPFADFAAFFRREKGRKSFDKVGFAREASAQFTREMLESDPDLKSKIADLIENIEKWNQQGEFY